MTDSCASCFFSRPSAADPSLLICCLNAPQVNAGVASKGLTDLFPIVAPGYWCGEGADDTSGISFSVDVNSLPTNLLSNFGPWSSYTPQFSSGIGAISTAQAQGLFTVVNKTLFFTASLHTTVNGTGAGWVNLSIPGAANLPPLNLYAVFHGAINNISKGAVGVVSDAQTNMEIYTTDGAYPGGDNTYIFMSGVTPIY